MKYQPQIVAAYFRECGLPAPEFEWRFHVNRKWRFDLAWPGNRVAMEVEGGIWTGGRHSRGKGIKADMEKYNTATLMGWRILRCVPAELCIRETVEMIRTALNRCDVDAGGATAYGA